MNLTLLGFDYGTRRIGVAVGQTITGTATPLETLRCPHPGQPDWTAVERLLRDWKPDAVVVGHPRNADDSDSAVTRAAERFARQLHGRFGVPAHLMDERLSSREAENRLKASGGKKARQSREAVDMMAACVILETWLSDYCP